MSKLRLSLPLLILCSCGPGFAEKAAEREPVNPAANLPPKVIYERGLGYAQRGDFIRGEQYIMTAVARGFPEEIAFPTLIRLCVASGRLSAALGYADPYLKRHPRDWVLRYLVASIHYGLGHREIARRELERVAKLAPNEPEPQYLLALVSTADGDSPKAKTHFQRYLELTPKGERAEEVRAALRELDRKPAGEVHDSRAQTGEGASPEGPQSTESPQ